MDDVDEDTIDTQKAILGYMKVHAKLEKASGTQIFPAMRAPRASAKFMQADMRK